MATTTIPTLPAGWVVSQTTTSSASAKCTTAVPGKNGHVSDPEACNAYWVYDPSFAAAVLFCVLFGLQTIGHVTQAILHKKGYCWVLIMGILWEFGSFVARAMSSLDQQKLSLLVVSQLLFVLAPLWTNAFAYMTLGRLIHFFHPQKRTFGIKAVSIAKYFVWADIVSFIVQGAGGSMMNPDNSADAQKIGMKLYMAGVGVQEGFIVIFAMLGIRFQLDMTKLEAQGQAHPNRTGWKGQMFTMYGVLTFISIRIIFRLVEYTRGTDPSNPILHNEAYIYALDALPMFLAILLLHLWHPGRVLVGPDSYFPKLSRKQKKELKAAKKEEKKMGKGKRQGGYVEPGVELFEADPDANANPKKHRHREHRRRSRSRDPYV